MVWVSLLSKLFLLLFKQTEEVRLAFHLVTFSSLSQEVYVTLLLMYVISKSHLTLNKNSLFLYLINHFLFLSLDARSVDSLVGKRHLLIGT